MKRILKQGPGWRLGWHPEAPEYQGLVGGEDWAFELTSSELQDFCRLAEQLAATMTDMARELMAEEKISCETETDLLWMEAQGYPDAYVLRLILNKGRSCEGNWPPEAVPPLLAAARSLTVF